MKKIHLLLPFLSLLVIQSSAFSQTDCSNETVINFNDLDPGTVLSSQLENSGIRLVSALNANTDHPDAAIIFNSSNPTGEDFDLGTPNEDFGGPGEGDGNNNNTALGNLLIIAEDLVDEDNDGLIDDPDDEARGGDVIFNFDNLSKIKSIKFVDIEDGVKIAGFSKDKELTFEVEIDESSENDVIDTDLLDMNDEENASLVVSLRDSGALAEIVFCHSAVSVTKKPVKIARVCKGKKRLRSVRNRKRLRRSGEIRRVLSKKGKQALKRSRC